MLDRPIESPTKAALTEAEVEAFWRDGVICVRGLYSPECVAKLSAALDDICSKPSPQTGGPRQGKFHSDLYSWLTNDIVRDFVLFGPSAKLAQQAFRSKRVNFYYDQIFVKEQLTPSPTPWHHDFTFWPLRGEQIASLWTSVDTVDADSSALEFVVGSHRWPNRFRAIGFDGTDFTTGHKMDDLPDINSDRSKFDIVSWEVKPGDALLFHALTLHGSRGNRSTKTKRRAIATRWCGDDVTYISKGVPELYRYGLNEGDHLSGPFFPQIFPQILYAEIAARLSGFVLPDPDKLPAAMEQLRKADRVQVRPDF
jgi:Phytanoyl-CoA dioxygenase (PhyH)